MRTHTITLIPGDGIGPEVTDAVVRILHASGVSIDWESHVAGLVAFVAPAMTFTSLTTSVKVLWVIGAAQRGSPKLTSVRAKINRLLIFKLG